MKDIAILGVDLGKNVCSLVGLDVSGNVVLRRRMKRDGLPAFAERLSPCVEAMEACCGAHHLGRVFVDRGHEVRLMSPEYVRPYVKAQKNDDRDAEAIAEAASRPTMRFVELKTDEQLDMQTLHRSRDRLVAERTALVNQLRGILLERGIVCAQGRRKFEQELIAVIDDEQGARLGARLVKLVQDMRAQWTELDRRIREFDEEFAAFAKADKYAALLMSIPGVGKLTASALIAAIGRAGSFAPNHAISRLGGGNCARRSTTAGKPKLLGIGQPGNKYLRKLMIHGARAALPATCADRYATRTLGKAAYWRERTRTWPSSPWPTSWRGSPGRCSGGGEVRHGRIIGCGVNVYKARAQSVPLNRL